MLREPSVQNVLCWARQPLKIKTNNNWFLIQTVAKEKHVGFSQPATASHETMKQIAAEKRAAKRSAESARSSVTAEAIAAAQAKTEIMG